MTATINVLHVQQAYPRAVYDYCFTSPDIVPTFCRTTARNLRVGEAAALQKTCVLSLLWAKSLRSRRSQGA